MEIICEVTNCAWNIEGKCSRRSNIGLNQQGQCTTYRLPFDDKEKELIKEILKDELN